MKLFLISPEDGFEDDVKEAIEKLFHDKYISLENRHSPLWIIVASPDKTAEDVSAMLGMINVGQANPHRGLVFQITDYHGFDSKALRQQLEVLLNK